MMAERDLTSLIVLLHCTATKLLDRYAFGFVAIIRTPARLVYFDSKPYKKNAAYACFKREVCLGSLSCPRLFVALPDPESCNSNKG